MQTSEFPDLPEADRCKPLVLLLGNIDHEGVISSLKSGGEQYKKKLLSSSPDNWHTIIQYFDAFTIRAVIIKLNARVYDLLARPEYKEIAGELLSRIAKAKHAAFVFEDLLSGEGERDESRQQIVRRYANPDPGDEEDLEFYAQHLGLYQPARQVIAMVNAALRSHHLNLIPYRTNADVTVIATQFLQDALEGLLFRIYVPSTRLWANEVDRLLQLFRDYLLSTGRKGVRLDQIRTDYGISYEFHGNDQSSTAPLSGDFQDFSHFLDLCVSDPKEAEGLLRGKSVDPREIAGILTRYSKEAKRLQVDLKHERERKLLSIRQRLESELADVLPIDADWGAIGSLIAKALPETFSVATVTSIDWRTLRGPLTVGGAQLTINLNPKIVNAVHSVVAQEIQGDLNVPQDEQVLLQLINQHADDRLLELTAAVQILSDKAIPRSERLTSAQKLKEFLFSLPKALAPTGINILTAYLEQKLGLK